MMWHIILFLAFMVICKIICYFLEADSDEYSPDVTDTSEYNQVVDVQMEETISTTQLAWNTIEHIGSEPKFTEEGRIQFVYQGVMFLMEAVDDCLFVNLIWPWCHSCSKYDIDEFARVRQVVNEINTRGTVSAFYGITDSDEIAVHLKKHFLLVSQIPNLEGYLKTMLDILFRTARTLEVEIEKYRLQEFE